LTRRCCAYTPPRRDVAVWRCEVCSTLQTGTRGVKGTTALAWTSGLSIRQ
jgi:hypothetical protein